MWRAESTSRVFLKCSLLFETGTFFVIWGLTKRLKASPRDLSVPACLKLRLQVCTTTTGCWGLNSNSHASLTNTTSGAIFPVLQTENYIHWRFIMCMSSLPICICTTCMLSIHRCQKRELDILVLELQTVMSCQMGSGQQTQVFYKGNKCF